MSFGSATAVALTFVWHGARGLVPRGAAEVPGAPGVTLPIGLGIGRLVFRTLNSAEALLAAGVLSGRRFRFGSEPDREWPFA